MNAVAYRLGCHGGDRKSQARAKDQGSDSDQGSKGRGRDYIVARLIRDGHAELAAQIRAGKVSAHRAAIEAGYRKAKPRYRTERHVCAQCRGTPDGKELPVAVAGGIIWLHRECRRFYHGG
jgi:hypothetical protein